MGTQQRWTFESQPFSYGMKARKTAIRDVNAAVKELVSASQAAPALAAEGILVLLRTRWRALGCIDDSGGSVGDAVRSAFAGSLIPILQHAPMSVGDRRELLRSLHEFAADEEAFPVDVLLENWGKVCGSQEFRDEWLNELLPPLRKSWARKSWRHRGAPECLSCLLESGRYDDMEDLLTLKGDSSLYLPFRVEALVRQGRIDDALTLAESGLHEEFWDCTDDAIMLSCEAILLNAGRREEAYERYSLAANRSSSYVAAFKAVARKFPEYEAEKILMDLAERSGTPGKWFKAAASAGEMQLAGRLAESASADPKTLLGVARAHVNDDPEFAMHVAGNAIKHLLAGRGYQPRIRYAEEAFDVLMAASRALGAAAQATAEVKGMLSRAPGRPNYVKALRNRLRRHRL